MRLGSMAALATASLFLAGCMTEAKYNQVQEIVRGSPAKKRDAVEICYKKAKKASAAEKLEAAKVMNISPRRDSARVFCQRAFDGVADGRITFEDFRTKNPRFIRVIQGR